MGLQGDGIRCPVCGHEIAVCLVIECVECGAKNRIPDPPRKDGTYSCASCGHTIDVQPTVRAESTGKGDIALGRTKSGEAASAKPGADAVSLSGVPPRGLAKVAGMNELRNLLVREVIRPLQEPELFGLYRLRPPNGILLYGPPGCGKTYIARQLAEEIGHFFVEVIPSEVASSYIHGSVLLIRDKFKTAAAEAPSLLL